jgi:hypothetical protein
VFLLEALVLLNPCQLIREHGVGIPRLGQLVPQPINDCLTFQLRLGFSQFLFPLLEPRELPVQTGSVDLT